MRDGFLNMERADETGKIAVRLLIEKSQEARFF